MSRLRGKDEATTRVFSRRQSSWSRYLPSWASARSSLVLVATTAILIVVWHVAVAKGWISEVILPLPTDVLDEIIFVGRSLFGGANYSQDAWVTLQEIVLGFALATSSAIFWGILVAEFRLVREMLMPYIVALNSTPKVAFVPIFVVWLGFGMSPKVMMAAFIAFFPVFVNIVSGLQSASREQLELMRSLQASRWQLLWRLKFPTALSFLFPAMRVAMALSIIGAIIGEFSAGAMGIGYLITLASAQFIVDRVFAFIILLSVLGYIMFGFLTLLERRVVYWQGPQIDHS